MLQNGSILPETLGLLKSLMAKPVLKDFNLAGGTSLALQIGHRLSVDLDFFRFQTTTVNQRSIGELYTFNKVLTS